jgi:hypothetical protein
MRYAHLPERDTMHPVFNELFILANADDLVAGEDRRRRRSYRRRQEPATADPPPLRA